MVDQSSAPKKDKVSESFDAVFNHIESLYAESVERKSEIDDKIAAGTQILKEFVVTYATMGYATGAKIITLEETAQKLDEIKGLSGEEKYNALAVVAMEIEGKNIAFVRTPAGKIVSDFSKNTPK